MGLSPNGCSVHVSIAAWPWGTYLGDDGLSNGIRVKTSSFSRHHVNSSMVRAKACGYYINSILAHQEPYSGLIIGPYRVMQSRPLYFIPMI